MPQVIDTHIHFYESSHIPRLAWTGGLPSDHLLKQENSIQQYRSVSQDVIGVVFIETDRLSGLNESDWNDALEEISFIEHLEAPILGIVAWAPVPMGPTVMAKYMARATAISSRIKGVRYLLQDKPVGVMLRPEFIEALLWLGQQALMFDLGVDARQGGIDQLREACELLYRVGEEASDRRVPRIVINHLCKPNLRLSVSEATGGHPEFTGWRECVQTLASHENTYMKLSGLFSELPPQEEGNPTGVDILLSHIKPWTDVVFDAFGASRIMFGSDWPVCNVGGPGTKQSWKHWVVIVEALLEQRDYSDAEKTRIWSGTARDVYGLG